MTYDVLCRTLIFGSRNAEQVATGQNIGKAPADVGQVTKAVRVASELDNAVGKGAQAAINVFSKASKENKALTYAAKGAKWASNNVNPLLVGAAGYRVLASDDKPTQLKREVFGMTAMFAAEGMAKELFASGKMEQLRNKIPNKYAKAAMQIIEGVLFVGASIGGSALGYKAGETLFPGKKQEKAPIMLKDEVAESAKAKNADSSSSAEKTV